MERRKKQASTLHTFKSFAKKKKKNGTSPIGKSQRSTQSSRLFAGTKASDTSAPELNGSRARKNKEKTKTYRPNILGRLTSKAPIALHIHVESSKGNSVLVTCASMILPTWCANMRPQAHKNGTSDSE